MKKLISTLLAGLLITSTAEAALYENITGSIITDGVIHSSIDTFTESGWFKADVVEISLADKDLELRVLTSPDGSSRVSTVKAMAEHYGTKVAVNADFFNVQSGETNMLGMVYQNGELISTPSKDNFVSFVIDENNRVLFDYFTFQGTLYGENTSLTEYAEGELYQINKVPLTTGGITMITSAWGKTVALPQFCYAMMCEPYGENEYKMTGFSWGSESVAIPEGGAVFTANYTINSFLNSNFAIGDIIRVETTISPDVDSIKEASGGNTLLVKDGEIAEFTSNITGKAQRTAMGLSPDGETLFLVTVDGRQTDCAGFTQTDMAEFMLSLGCSDAINLDGGGSTTLVAEDRFTGAQTVKNEVTSLRKVSTAIGVISLAETAAPTMGELKASRDTILLGDKISLSYVFYDDNYNSSPVDLSDIEITCSDPYAIIDSNTVMPTSEGSHTIWVNYNDIELEAEVSVLSDIFAINIYPEVVSATDRDHTFTVTAYDKSGHSAPVPSSLLTFETTGEITMDGSTVKKGEGKGTVTAMYENLTSTAVVNGEKHEREADVKAADTFEGLIENGTKITISGEIEAPENLIGKFQAKTRLSDLATRGDVYYLAENLYDPWGIFTVYRKTNGFTQRIIDNTQIVTISNLKSSSIRLTETNAWANLQIVCSNIKEDNLVLITNEPIYNMNAGEQKVWNHYMNILTEKGVNVFVVSMGAKSEATVENGVRYLYVGSAGSCMNASFEYGLKASAPLTLTFSGDEIKYIFN